MSVELRPAYAWDCDECGRENFSNGIVAELSNEERDELRTRLLTSHGLVCGITPTSIRMRLKADCREPALFSLDGDTADSTGTDSERKHGDC
jgi:hypothetical protein